LRPPENQRMHVMSTFIGIDRLKVLGVPHHVIRALNAVAAMHVASLARNVERLAAIVAFDQRNHFRGRLRLVKQLADAQRSLKAERNLGLHVGKLLLVELRRSERPAELLAVKPILARPEPAIPRSPHHAPRNAITRPVEAAEWTL